MLILLAKIKVMSHDLIIMEADKRLQAFEQTVSFPNEIWEPIRAMTYWSMLQAMERFLDRMFSPLLKIK